MIYGTNLSRFYGDGSRNEKGQTLEEFLEAYNPKKYDCPAQTVDMLIFQIGNPLKLLMIKRRNHPSIGWWALPGGFVGIRENLEDAAARELMEETGLSDIPLMQVKTWGDADRDPRYRVITTTYLALLEEDIAPQFGDDAADAVWMDVNFTETKNEQYHLALQNDEKQISLSADIRRHIEPCGLLQRETYDLLTSDGIAADHALLIADGLRYLQEKSPLPDLSESGEKRNQKSTSVS